MIKMNELEYEQAHNYDLSELWGLFKELNPGSLLDVGCGTGRVLKFLYNNFQHKFRMTGIEQNPDLWTEAKLKQFDEMSVDIITGNFLDLDFHERADYLAFISSIHQFQNTQEVVEMIDSLTRKAVIVKTVDTARIAQSTIRILFPQVKEMHFPIHSTLTAKLRRKGFKLTLEKSVQYRILTNTEYYKKLCMNRFVSVLHNLTDEEIIRGTDIIISENFYRSEVISYLVYERDNASK